jgi:hypothetical protein
MKMKTRRMMVWVAGLALAMQAHDLMAQVEETAAPAVYPAAILAFQERGAGVKGYGSTAADILFGELVVNPELMLVDREDLQKTLSEQELSLSGMVSPGDAIKIGGLIGAKILITGSVIDADRSTYLVAKIIGTETSRVLGASVKGESGDDLSALVAQLAQKVGETITARGSELVAKTVSRDDRLAALKAKMPAGERPALFVSIQERHVGQATIDPAAETELSLFAKHVDFPVLDPDSATRKDADIVISGEGFSEFAMRRGNMVSVKARLEIKAVDRKTDKVIAIDRQTAVVVDLSEQVAGKAALQEAAAQIAERMLPKLVKK